MKSIVPLYFLPILFASEHNNAYVFITRGMNHLRLRAIYPNIAQQKLSHFAGGKQDH